MKIHLLKIKKKEIKKKKTFTNQKYNAWIVSLHRTSVSKVVEMPKYKHNASCLSDSIVSDERMMRLSIIRNIFLRMDEEFTTRGHIAESHQPQKRS